MTIYSWAYIWTLYSVLLIYVSIFVQVPYCFDYWSCVEYLEIWDCDTSSFILLFQDYFSRFTSFSRFYFFKITFKITLELCSISWNLGLWYLQLYSFSRLLWLFRVFHKNFRIVFSSSIKNVVGILMKISLTL